MASKRIQEISDFTVVPGLSGVTAATISTEIAQTAQQSGPLLIIKPKLNGTVSNATLTFSISIKDENGEETWSATQVSTLRTLPDATKVAPFLVFNVYRSQHIKVALETAVTGGGTVTALWASAITV